MNIACDATEYNKASIIQTDVCKKFKIVQITLNDVTLDCWCFIRLGGNTAVLNEMIPVTSKFH